MKRRWIALVLAVAMVLCLFVSQKGLGGAAVPQIPVEARKDIVSYLTDGGLNQEDVVLTVNGQEITARAYLYWLGYYVAMMRSNGYDESALEEEENGVPIYQTIQESGERMAVNYTLLQQKAEEAGLSLTEEEEEQVASAGQEQEGMEETMLYCCTSPEDQMTLYRQSLLGEKLQSQLFDEGSEEAPTPETLRDYGAENGYYTCRYIRFPTKDTDGNALDGARVEEECRSVYEELTLSSADREKTFQSYQETYNTTERGSDGNTDRFTFQADDVVSGFSGLIADMEDNQIAMTEEPTEEYGYFILLRLPLDTEDKTLQSDYISYAFNALLDQWVEEAEVVRTEDLEGLDALEFCKKLIAFQDLLDSANAGR